MLGGVEIPFARGLLGHSDADVLLHALMDALLGAAALGDIGHLFPDSDSAYERADSRALLREVGRRLGEAGFTVGNVDATLIAQRPKVAPYVEQMRRNIASDLSIPLDRVSVKATTEEGLGFTGTGQGICAQAITLLTSPGDYCYDYGMEAGRCGGCPGCGRQEGGNIQVEEEHHENL